MSERPSIQIRSAQRKLQVELESLQEFAERALARCLNLPACVGSPGRELGEINVVLVSDRRMAALHQEFMNIPGPTDVLTFQHGEIVVSVETAQQNAERFATSAADEIKLYVIHGLLHLLGFDDRTREEARVMEAVQAEVLRAVRPA
ncbi:MAG TPA: rRNA maturation RNase YbeY [Chthoniobacterales bacterium]|nr:rRNA maturation RNase YbeY [Chthoniobacterales bacterium]